MVECSRDSPLILPPQLDSTYPSSLMSDKVSLFTSQPTLVCSVLSPHCLKIILPICTPIADGVFTLVYSRAYWERHCIWDRNLEWTRQQIWRRHGISPLLSSSSALSPCCELDGAALWVCTAAIIIPLKPMTTMTALIGWVILLHLSVGNLRMPRPRLPG